MALPTVGAVFGAFRIFFFSKKLKFIFLCKKGVESECRGPVKHIYSIQTMILTRLLWLSGISKICVSFADKHIILILIPDILLGANLGVLLYICRPENKSRSLKKKKKGNRKAMNRNWSNQKANPALKTKAGNK